MFTITYDYCNKTETVSTERYSEALIQYHFFREMNMSATVKMIEDGFVIRSTDFMDAVVPVPRNDCIGIMVRHTKRGPRAFVVKFSWVEEICTHVVDDICDYDAATCYDVAIRHAKTVASSMNLLYVD